jgi:hypothetical protein
MRKGAGSKCRILHADQGDNILDLSRAHWQSIVFLYNLRDE